MDRYFIGLIFLSFILSCSSTKESTQTYTSEFLNSDSYYNYRYELLKKSKKNRFDYEIGLLDSVENVANSIFLELVQSEKERLKDIFPPAQFFCNIKKKMEVSPFFELIDKIPKSTMTRGHIQSIGDYSWLIDQAFESADCYIYLGGDNESWANHSLHFFSKPPNEKWRSVKALNTLYEGGFKKDVYQLITLGKEDYPYENIKDEYDKIIKRTQGLISYRPIFREYLKKICEDLIEKKILYMEIHSSFNGMYDMKRSYFNAEQEMDLYVSIRNEIKKTYPDFGFKVIYSISQSDKGKSIKEHYQTALDLFDSYPDVFGGFDFAQGKAYDKSETKALVNQYFKTKQDPYYSEMFLPLLFNPEEKEYFFHEGIYDAILLNSKRVGYAYEIYKHPELMKLLKEKNIAVELSPISNQVFGSAPDLRHHPATVYINHGIPFILGCENQGILKYSFTHQFYNAILAWDLDLGALKKTIINSVNYSLASDDDKEKILLIWGNQWKVFIQEILHNSKRYKY